MLVFLMSKFGLLRHIQEYFALTRTQGIMVEVSRAVLMGLFGYFADPPMKGPKGRQHQLDSNLQLQHW